MEYNSIGRFLEKLLELFGGIVSAFILICCWPARLPDDFCDNKSKQYKYARSLPQQRLEKIYIDFKSFAEQERYLKHTLKRTPDNPKEFSDLEYTRLILDKYTIKNDYAIMRLSFCMDQSIDIEVHGLLSKHPQVKIVWGELDRLEEVLWEKTID